MRQVAVRDKDVNTLVIYKIVLGGLNYPPADAEYFREAKRLAVEDALVAENKQDSLRFDFVR